MRDPVVSVVMGVRDGEKYLRQSVSSLLGQTLTDLELLIVDDGSTDATPEIVREFQRRDPRVHFVASRGSGLAAALNEGIDIARGEWVARMDADDVSESTRLERQVAHARAARLDICGTQVRTTGTFLARRISYYRQHESILLRQLFNSAFCHPSVLVRRDLLKTHKYDDSIRRAQDYELWTRLLMHGARAGNLDDALLTYRLHRAQTTRRHNAEQVQSVIAAAIPYWCWLLQCTDEASARSLSAVVAPVINKSTLLSHKDLDSLLSLFAELGRRFGNPENVLGQELTYILLRAPAALSKKYVQSKTGLSLPLYAHGAQILLTSLNAELRGRLLRGAKLLLR